MKEVGRRVLGVIGGSGLYALEGLTHVRWEKVTSPFGEPSDEVMHGELDGVRVVFLPRHGRGHRLPPASINYRANIDVLKRVGVTDVISMSAVGSLKEELTPGTFVLVDQFIDRTLQREKTFFGPGLVAHVSLASPVCTRVADGLEASARERGIRVSRGGTCLVMEGPQFSTLAESRMYRTWGCEVIGMTSMPEAKLAREAELCYSSVAMVTDFDCWHPTHEAVTVSDVVAVMNGNAAHARELIRAVIPGLSGGPDVCPRGCDRALEHALITAPEARDAGLLARLDAVAGRVLRRHGKQG